MGLASRLGLVVGIFLAPWTAEGSAAFLVIDVQDCFLDKNTSTGVPGSLAVPASHIIQKVNQIRQEKSCLFQHVVFSQDYHPSGHISFGSSHGLAGFAHLGSKGGLPMKCIRSSTGNTADAACCPSHFIDPSSQDCDVVLCTNYTVENPAIVTNNPACTTCREDPSQCFDQEQAMWPDHCVQPAADGTAASPPRDAGFPTVLDKRDGDTVVQKGTSMFVDAYSAFMDNTQTLKTALDSTLRSLGVTELYIAGIATDVCVHATVRDATTTWAGRDLQNYTVTVISDATAAVLGDQTNFDNAITEMRGFGATMKTTAEILAMACPTAATTTAAAASSEADGAPASSGAHVLPAVLAFLVLLSRG